MKKHLLKIICTIFIAILFSKCINTNKNQYDEHFINTCENCNKITYLTYYQLGSSYDKKYEIYLNQYNPSDSSITKSKVGNTNNHFNITSLYLEDKIIIGYTNPNKCSIKIYGKDLEHQKTSTYKIDGEPLKPILLNETDRLILNKSVSKIIDKYSYFTFNAIKYEEKNKLWEKVIFEELKEKEDSIRNKFRNLEYFKNGVFALHGAKFVIQQHGAYIEKSNFIKIYGDELNLKWSYYSKDYDYLVSHFLDTQNTYLLDKIHQDTVISLVKENSTGETIYNKRLHSKGITYFEEPIISKISNDVNLFNLSSNHNGEKYRFSIVKLNSNYPQFLFDEELDFSYRPFLASTIGGMKVNEKIENHILCTYKVLEPLENENEEDDRNAEYSGWYILMDKNYKLVNGGRLNETGTDYLSTLYHKERIYILVNHYDNNNKLRINIHEKKLIKK